MKPTIYLPILSCLLICFLLPLGCTKEAPSFICRITDVTGSVQLHKSGAAKPVDAQKGLKLGPGDRVMTGAKASVRLQFRDFATVVLGEKALYVVTSQKTEKGKGIVETSTELLKGIGLVKVDKTKGKGFKIKTPHVITGVLGTEFGLEVEDGDDDDDDDDDDGHDEGRGLTSLAVIQGLVSFEGLGERLEVRGGWGARCNGFAPPGLVKKFSDLSTKLTNSLQGFIKEEAKGKGDLKTIFRFY